MTSLPDGGHVKKGTNEFINFGSFFECWIEEQSQLLEEMVSTLQKQGDAAEDTTLCPLVGRVIQHYEQYYEAKSYWAKIDVLSMFSPSWTSSIEDAFLWIGGWRPCMAFQLLYSKSGMQLVARLESKKMEGFKDDLGEISATQLKKVDDLQRETVKKEKEITEKLAKLQQTLADSSMVELSHTASELNRSPRDGFQQGRVEELLAIKIEGLISILKRADDLRVKTLKGILEVLTPLQSMQFLIAAAELHLRIHEWGKELGGIKAQG